MTDRPVTNGRIHTIKLWVNAFIPSTYVGAEPVPAGIHAGKTMLTTLWVVNRCFLTDDRTFSNNVHAQSRLHSEVEIDVQKKKVVYEFHHCHETVEIDCTSGEEKCRQHGDTNHMHFENFAVAEAGGTFSIDLKASAKNPCLKVANVKLSPNVDLYGTITIQLSADNSAATVRFEGMIETYPAFEMYVAFNGSEVGQPVFQLDVEAGATAANITGAPTRPVNVEALIRREPADRFHTSK